MNHSVHRFHGVIPALALSLLLSLPSARAQDATPSASEDNPSQNVEWSYIGPGGPENWSGIHEDYHACGGQRQSPIDLTDSVFVRVPNWLGVRYTENVKLSGSVVNDGRNVFIETGGRNHLLVGGIRYDLYRITFHRPSEHLVNGKTFPLEIQFLHRSALGEQVGVVIFAERSRADHPIIDEIWRAVPSTKGSRSRSGLGNFDPRLFFPLDRSGWRYYGSMTEPPCAENVLWFVLTEPVTVSQRQLDRLRIALPNRNARPVAERGRRFLLFSE